MSYSNTDEGVAPSIQLQLLLIVVACCKEVQHYTSTVTLLHLGPDHVTPHCAILDCIYVTVRSLTEQCLVV